MSGISASEVGVIGNLCKLHEYLFACWCGVISSSAAIFILHKNHHEANEAQGTELVGHAKLVELKAFQQFKVAFKFELVLQIRNLG